jgi:kynureninase
MGHTEPFAFSPTYAPADGIGRFACGTPPILSLAALECGVDVALQVGVDAVRVKSLALTDLLIDLVDARCAAHPLTVITPRDPARRGSQVSLRHDHAYEVCQALIARGVIGDFRAPDILRLGVAPLYIRYVDVFDAVAALTEVLDTRAWDDPPLRRRNTVT